MQFTNKTKIASAAVVAGTLTVGVVAARLFQPTVESAPVQALKSQQLVVKQSAKQPEQSSREKGTFATPLRAISANPIDPKAAKAAEDQANRSLVVEKEARQFLKEQRFGEAEQACYRALALSPKWHGQPMASTTFQLLGDIHLEQGRYKDALGSYFQARQHTRELGLDLGIALCYLKLGDLKNAHAFYDEHKVFTGRLSDQTPAKRAVYLAQLPGTKTDKTMEASIYFARGCEKSSFADRTAAVEDYKKALNLVPCNALIASKCAWDLGSIYRGEEATQYWARAVVFGTGEMAREARIELKNVLMPDKVEQALADARKIKG